MQLSQTPPSPTPQVQRIKAKPWPFLAPSHVNLEGDLMANARRVIAKTKAHLMESGKQ
jgi:hypothetical protein